MHYKKNFLSKVIFRLDFEPPFLNISEESASSFSLAVKEKYPFVVSGSIMQISFKIGPAAPGNAPEIDRQMTGRVWEHREKEKGDKVLLLSPNFLSLEYQNRKYTTFDEFKEDMTFFYEKFQSIFALNVFKRIGLRYINEISIPEGNPLNWEGYINNGLINGTLAGLNNGMNLTRSMHQFWARCRDDISVLFQYGMFNPEFPNPIARRQYILDIDCFISGNIERSEVVDRLSNLNTIATERFEHSIEEELRKLMEVAS